MTEKSHWHLMRLDDQAYKLITDIRKEMLKERGHHASYSDAVRHLNFLSHIATDVTVWYWKCGNCGKVIQSSVHREIPEEPSECYSEQGGCGRVSHFKNITLETLQQRVRELEKPTANIEVNLKVNKKTQ